MYLVNLPRLVLYQLVLSATERLIVSLKLMVILVISHNDLNCDDFLNPLTPKSDKISNFSLQYHPLNKH